MERGQDADEMLKEIDRKQGAAKWPETLEAGRSVDEFMWKGDPKATLVQRIGLLIFGALFLFLFVVAVIILATRTWEGLLVGLVIGSFSGIFSFRFLRNAFKRKPR